MKTSIKFLFFCSFLALTASKCPDGVDPQCSGYGYLKVTNASISTVHVVLIDNTNYGSLTAGRSETYKLATGKHSYEIKSANGRGGCSPGSVTIVECDTDALECRN